MFRAFSLEGYQVGPICIVFVFLYILASLPVSSFCKQSFYSFIVGLCSFDLFIATKSSRKNYECVALIELEKTYDNWCFIILHSCWFVIDPLLLGLVLSLINNRRFMDAGIRGANYHTLSYLTPLNLLGRCQKLETCHDSNRLIKL